MTRVRVLIRFLFPETPAAPSPPREALWAAVTGMAVVALTVARAPFIADRFWAEDGSVFYQEALTDGPITSFGHWYAGYLHTIPRGIATIAVVFPVREGAAVFAICVLAILGAGAAFIEWRAGAYVTARALRVAIALSVALLPVLGQEAIGNAANLQFFLVYFGFWFLLWFPRHTATVLAVTVVLLLTSLSTLIAVFLVPLAMLRLVERGRRGRWLPTLGLLAGLVVQVVGRRIVHPGRGIGGAPVSDTISWFNASVVGNLRPGAPVAAFGDPSAPPFEPGPVVIIMWLVVLAALAVVFVGTFIGPSAPPGETGATGTSPDGSLGARAPGPATARTFIAATLALALISGFAMALASGTAPRYAVLPSLLFAAALGVACDATLVARPARSGWIPVGIVAAAAIATVATGWSPNAVRDQPALSWSAGVDDARAQGGDQPVGIVDISSSPSTWGIVVRCADLVR